MNLLLDQDVYALTARALQAAGHDVVMVAASHGARAHDIDILHHAHRVERLLITRDADFGALVFVRRMSAGVVYLRMTPANTDEVHSQLIRVLATHTYDELRSSFTVVESGRYRMRRIASSSANDAC